MPVNDFPMLIFAAIDLRHTQRPGLVRFDADLSTLLFFENQNEQIARRIGLNQP